MVSKRDICNFLDGVTKEEKLAKEIYSSAKRRFPNEAKTIEKIAGQELKHARELSRLSRKYGCK